MPKEWENVFRRQLRANFEAQLRFRRDQIIHKLICAPEKPKRDGPNAAAAAEKEEVKGINCRLHFENIS